MMRWIIGTSLKFRFLVLAIGAILMYFGFLRLRDLPIDVFPEFAPAKVEIQTIALGLSPSEVESLVTLPLEKALAGVPGVADLRSRNDQFPKLRQLLKSRQPDVVDPGA